MYPNILQIRVTWSDTTKIQALGYKAETPIEEGVAKFIEWYKGTIMSTEELNREVAKFHNITEEELYVEQSLVEKHYSINTICVTVVSNDHWTYCIYI